MNIIYASDRRVSVDDFIDLLKSTSLGERRPVDDRDRIEAMLKNSSLIISAWDTENNELVGIARSVTDYAYCCYLSDLAVRGSYQRNGIGKKLIQCTKEHLHNEAKLILLAAPDALEYYPHLGFKRHEGAFYINDAIVI